MFEQFQPIKYGWIANELRLDIEVSKSLWNSGRLRIEMCI